MNSYKTLFWFATLLFFITGCETIYTRKVDTEDKNNMIISIVDPLGLAVTLPEGMVQQASAEQPLFCFQDSLNTRYPRCFSIIEIEALPGKDFSGWEFINLGAGGKFYYQSKLVNVGSGGPEEHLTGYVEINDRYFKIQASAQQRSGIPDATWCVPIIQTLRYETE